MSKDSIGLRQMCWQRLTCRHGVDKPKVYGDIQARDNKPDLQIVTWHKCHLCDVVHIRQNL